MKTTAVRETKKAKETRNIQISLKVEDGMALQKLTQADSSMPSWILGEEIAKRLDKGRRNIEINLSDLFLVHQV